MLRFCSTCKIEKEIAEFSRKRAGWNYCCKSCHKVYRRNHYIKNKQRYVDKAKAWTKQRKLKFLEWLKTQSCCDCGISDYRVFEFDHTSTDKLHNVSFLLHAGSDARLWSEIVKCDIVCANCHRIRTIERLGGYKSLAS